jgi:methylated-DNA-protein-cysteine methyltransferase-like protein
MMDFTEQVIEILQSVPSGKVVTYGQVARLAGNPRGARQVVRILHSMTNKYNLPWHRVINSQGKISIPDPFGAEEQRGLLLSEGVEVSDNFRISLKTYQWDP